MENESYICCSDIADTWPISDSSDWNYFSRAKYLLMPKFTPCVCTRPGGGRCHPDDRFLGRCGPGPVLCKTGLPCKERAEIDFNQLLVGLIFVGNVKHDWIWIYTSYHLCKHYSHHQGAPLPTERNQALDWRVINDIDRKSYNLITHVS